MVRGTKQEVVFDPAKYSFDFDKMISARSLDYKFYCQAIDNGVPQGYPMATFTTMIDLLSFQRGLYPNFQMHANRTCFMNTEKYEFDATEKILTIREGAFTFYPNRIYEFLISTEYLGKTYSQKTKVAMRSVGVVPKVELNCKFPATCKPFPAYQKINPSTQQMVVSTCKVGCENVSTITYQWNLYRFFKISPDDVQEKWVQYVNKSYVKGDDTSELTISSSVFTTNPDVEKWKVEFSLTAISKQNGNLSFRLSKLFQRST